MSWSPSRWIGRAWWLVGLGFVATGLAAAAVCLLAAFYDGDQVFGSFAEFSSWAKWWLAPAALFGLGWVVIGLGRRRLASSDGALDWIDRAYAPLRRPGVPSRVLGTLGVLAVLGAVALVAFVNDHDRRWTREQSGFQGFELIHGQGYWDAGNTGVITGRVDPENVNEFVRRNQLTPDPEASNLGYMAAERQIRWWERHWPKNPKWYSRRMPRPHDTCHYGCSVLCLLDVRSGRVWIALESPDFAGD